MKIDLNRLDNMTLIQRRWVGDIGSNAACAMGAMTGRDSEQGCVADGWPLWLVQLVEDLNDNLPPETFADQMRTLGHAADAAVRQGLDVDALWRAVRLNAVLPIAMEAIGAGNEGWRVKCRAVVQWSIDHNGQAADFARAAEAADFARAADAAGAARAADAVWAAGTVGATWATWAARAAGAAEDAAWQRIYDATLAEFKRQARS